MHDYPRKISTEKVKKLPSSHQDLGWSFNNLCPLPLGDRGDDVDAGALGISAL